MSRLETRKRHTCSSCTCSKCGQGVSDCATFGCKPAANDEKLQLQQHTKTESLVIAAEDFITDVDSLLVAISGLSLSHFTDRVEDSMGRLVQAIDATKGEERVNE